MEQADVTKFQGKTVVVGVCGSVAAYKACDLVRDLCRAGARVEVILTAAATKFVTPLTMEALVGHRVYSEAFITGSEPPITHIELARVADLVLIAPATAQSIHKLAAGAAEDLLSTVLIATRAPVLLAPAMNDNMLGHPAVQENIQRLRAWGYYFVEPGHGLLACGVIGQGRLADLREIEVLAEKLLTAQDLEGKAILVTAGGTREPLDPVRFIGNRSSGRMGYAIAAAAWQRGAMVTLVSGPSEISPPIGPKVIHVETAEEMYSQVLGLAPAADIVIKAAAVADFRPLRASQEKIKKGSGQLLLELEHNPDILAELGRRKRGQVLVGFAAETEDLLRNAQDKLARKNLDLIVANDVTARGDGFGSETNTVHFIYPDGRVEGTGRLSKSKIAHLLLDRILDLSR